MRCPALLTVTTREFGTSSILSSSEAVAGSTNPAEQLEAFAKAYVRFAAEEHGLFEVTFMAGLEKNRYPELNVEGSG